MRLLRLLNPTRHTLYGFRNRTVADAKGLHCRGATASVSLSVTPRPGSTLGLRFLGDLGQVKVSAVDPGSDVASAIASLPVSTVGASELKALLLSEQPSSSCEISLVSVNGIPLLSKEQLQFFLDTAAEKETLKLSFGIELPRNGMDQPAPRSALDDVADFLAGSS